MGACFSIIFSLWGDRLLNCCISLCLLYCGPLGALGNHLALLFSVAAKHLGYTTCHQYSEIGKTENSLLGNPGNSGTLDTHTTLFHPRVNPGFGSVFLLIPPWFRARDYSEWMLQTITFDFSHSPPYTFSCQHLDAGKTDGIPLGGPSKKVRLLILILMVIRSIFLFFSWKRSQELGASLQL